MVDELLDICNEHNVLTGRALKSFVHKQGLWHRTAQIWVYNSQGDVLMQLRSLHMELNPGKWDMAVAGHVKAGDEPKKTALREAQEELGLLIKNIQFYKIVKISHTFENMTHNVFAYVYLVLLDEELKVRLQKEEVKEVTFFPLDELSAKVKSNPEEFVPHTYYWGDVLKEIKKRVEKK